MFFSSPVGACPREGSGQGEAYCLLLSGLFQGREKLTPLRTEELPVENFNAKPQRREVLFRFAPSPLPWRCPSHRLFALLRIAKQCRIRGAMPKGQVCVRFFLAGIPPCGADYVRSQTNTNPSTDSRQVPQKFAAGIFGSPVKIGEPVFVDKPVRPHEMDRSIVRSWVRPTVMARAHAIIKNGGA